MARKIRRRKSSGTATAATRKFGKKVYKKVSCSKTKTAAKAVAKKLRAQGKKARVVSSKNSTGCKHAVYSTGAAASVGKKRRVRRRRKA